MSQPLPNCPLHGFIGITNATFRSDMLKNLPMKPFPGDYKITAIIFTDLGELYFHTKLYLNINI